MFLNFLAGLVLSSLAIRLLGFPIGYIFFVFPYVIIKKVGPAFMTRWLFFEYEIVLALLSSAMLATIAAHFDSSLGVTNKLVYFTTGFVVNTFILSTNVKETRRLLIDVLPQEIANADAARTGFAIGVFAYPLVYFSPVIIQTIPGMSQLLKWIFGIADWSMEIWIVKAIFLLYISLSVLLRLLSAIFARSFRALWSAEPLRMITTQRDAS